MGGGFRRWEVCEKQCTCVNPCGSMYMCVSRCVCLALHPGHLWVHICGAMSMGVGFVCQGASECRCMAMKLSLCICVWAAVWGGVYVLGGCLSGVHVRALHAAQECIGIHW